jgi:starch phosphorylase
VAEGWSEVRILDVEGDVTAASVGEQRSVTARIVSGRLEDEDLDVQLAHGGVGANGELTSSTLVEMKLTEHNEGVSVYRGTFATEAPGLYGFAVRVIPAHRDLSNPLDLGLVRWA